MNTKQTYIILVLIISGIFISSTARSQVLISLLLGDKLNSGGIEFGLTGGYGMTSIIKEPDSKHQNTFFLGFYFDILLKKQSNWYLYTGVLVKSKMGASDIPVYDLGDAEMDSVFGGGNVTRRISYFNVPIEIKYRFNSGIYVDAGMQLGLMHKAYDDFNNTIVEKNDLTFSKDIKTEIKGIDAGVAGGLGYKFQKGIGMNIGLRYYYGLVDIYKDNRPGTNSVLYILAEIPIGAGKAKEKENGK